MYDLNIISCQYNQENVVNESAANVNMVNKCLTELEEYIVQEFSNSNSDTLEEIINHFNSQYSDAAVMLATEPERASEIAAYLFLRDILTSDRFQNLRNNVSLNTIDDLEVFTASFILQLDFDRSFNISSFVNVNGEIELIPLNEPSYYLQRLQVLLVQKLFDQGKIQILEKYQNNIKIVQNGELTDLGNLLALMVPLSYTGVTRLLQDEITILNTFSSGYDISENLQDRLNNLQISQEQREYIIQTLNEDIDIEYFPDYNTIFANDPIYAYLSDLLSGRRNDYHRGILAISATQTEGIDVYFAAHRDPNILQEIESGQNMITKEQFDSRLRNLFPVSEVQRFLILRSGSIYLGRSNFDEYFRSALPIINTPSVRYVYEINNYIPEIDLSSKLSELMTDQDFQGSLPLFHILSIIDKATTEINLEAGLENIVDLRKIFISNSAEMYEMSANPEYIPYQIDKFRGWLDYLVQGNLATLNPSEEQLSPFPDTFSIIFSGEQIFIRIREFSESMNLKLEHKYLVDQNGFHETFDFIQDGQEYLIILSNLTE